MRNCFLRLAVFLVGLGSVSCFCVQIAPVEGESVWSVVKKLGQDVDANREDVAYIRNEDAVGGIITISSPGYYRFGERITCFIAIDSDNVCLDFNSNALEVSASTESAISFNAAHHNIKIVNGMIYNAAGSGGNGIEIHGGSYGVTVDSMRIDNFASGIFADGASENEVLESEIVGCDFARCGRGIYLVYTLDTVVRNCRAVKCTIDGYFFLNCQRSCILDSQAISISGDQTVAGFRSGYGMCNLFQGCVSKNIITNAVDFGSKSYGFLFAGAEERSKITNCIVDEVDMNLTGSAVAYGICLESEILPSDGSLLSQITLGGLPDAITSVAWSPCTQYLAFVYQSNLLILKFDGSTLKTVGTYSIDSIINPPIRFIDWSPNGKWIVLGTSLGGVEVLKFDNNTITKLQGTNLTGSVEVVKWSLDNKHIAVGSTSGNIIVYDFNGSTLTLSASFNYESGSVTSLCWSPDGNYICACNLEGSVYMLKYIGAELTYMEDTDMDGLNPNCVSWSPNGRFIALARDHGVSILTFDGTTLSWHISHLMLDSVAEHVDWSPNGEYLVYSYYYLYNSTIKVLRFDETTALTYLGSEYIVSGMNDYVYGVGWSTCGRYISACSEDGELIILNAMFGPHRCLVQDCKVCDIASSGTFYGVGIAGGGANSFLNNSACQNEFSYSRGIPNVYYQAPDELVPLINIGMQNLP